ncbi:MAG: hypothetical protein U0354_10605 [Candidatus Sericytochromatia bacterium]
MAQSNQPFKRPNLSEKEEYQRIPPPDRQKGNGNNQNTQSTGSSAPASTPMPPSQEEIDWAIQIEEKVQKQGYKPTEAEMSKYQDIANRIVLFQQAQAQAQKIAPRQQQVFYTAKPKSKLWRFIKFLTLISLLFFFWAKVSIVVLQPSYFTPRGKIYLVIKPINFSTVYYSINMDKVYDEKLRKGFTKDDLNLDIASSKKKKGTKKVNPNWYTDPQYWEDNYLIAFPYPKLPNI